MKAQTESIDKVLAHQTAAGRFWQRGIVVAGAACLAVPVWAWWIWG